MKSCEEKFRFFYNMGSPKKVVAPMVDQSELAFRMLCRKYGAELVYTQMIHSGSFIMSNDYRKEVFTTIPEDRPLIAQFCGNDPQTLLRAAKMIENDCDAIDLNIGCPQGIAKRGHYGAYLMEELDLLHEIAGASLLTIHGRIRAAKGHDTGPPDWEMIKRIKEHFAGRVPIIANGGIENMDDFYRCLEHTGADGVMTSEAVLENPAFFSMPVSPSTNNISNTARDTADESGEAAAVPTQLDLAEEYLALCLRYPSPLRMVRSHVMKFLYRYFQVHTDLRERTAVETKTVEDLQDCCVALRKVVKDEADYPVSWYNRFRFPAHEHTVGGKKLSEMTANGGNFVDISVWECGEEETDCGLFNGLGMFVDE